jgi:hypothetical protein
MVDLDAAIGFVVAHGDLVDRARCSWLRSGIAPDHKVLDQVEIGQSPDGGWPAIWGTDDASIDATCFRLAELDDLGALYRPPAQRAVDWLAGRQRPDGTWEETEKLAGVAPPYAQPGDDEARLFLTASAGFWLAVAGGARVGPQTNGVPPEQRSSTGYLGLTDPLVPRSTDNPHATAVARAAEAFRAALRPDGSWPSYLPTGWFGAALLFHLGWFYETAQIQVILAERVETMSPADTAWMAATLRRLGLATQDRLMVAARIRLSRTQRSDGGWSGDDGAAFDVHTTLQAIRALR